jgi:catechol 2,3-dioxygenase-like lactoylglutathione lyase family enzyme
MSINTVALSGAHMEVRSIEETAPILTDLLALERVEAGPDWLTLKHPNTPWLMTLHEAGPGATPKASHNHYGVRVISKEEIDAAHTYLHAHASEYGLTGIREPENQHGSYSVYFVEPGSNTLEIECYADVARKDAGVERLGGVRGDHWEQPLPPGRFPGRGYVPQALTHGTLAVRNAQASHRFYGEVLGLDVHIAYGQGRVVYVKHPATRHFIVSAKRDGEPHLNPSTFRYTLTVPSSDDLTSAHRWMSEHAGEYSIAEVHDIETRGTSSSFLVRDPDMNWWEIATLSTP